MSDLTTRMSQSDSRDSVGQSADLRTRIAAAIHNDNGFGWSKYMCEEAADAVIADLGIHYQYENQRTMYDTKPKACAANGNWQVRIVSPHTIYRESSEDL